jgi:hypothetical protein
MRHVTKTQASAAELRARVTFLKNSGLFPQQAHADCIALASKLARVTYARNEILCQAGERAAAFWFVLSGEVLVQHHPPGSEPGERAGLAPNHDWNVMLRHGAVLQEDVLVGGGVHDATAVCHSQTADVYKVRGGGGRGGVWGGGAACERRHQRASKAKQRAAYQRSTSSSVPAKHRQAPPSSGEPRGTGA